MSFLRTPLTETFGNPYPIILAGMGYVSQPGLAAAVSNAGGLGTLRSQDADTLRDEIRRVRDLTDCPFGVDILFATVATSERAAYTDNVQRCIEIICQERPAYLISGLGNPAQAVPDLHAAGIKVMALVGNVRNARRVAEGGVDFIVAQGHEAGGHTGRISGMVLVPSVVDAVSVPVVAAGGISDPRQFVAALALGACGILVGTRYIATHEANVHANYKNWIVEIDEEGTTITRAYTGKTCRVLRNKVTEEWRHREAEILPMGAQQKRMEELYFPGIHYAGRRVDGPGDVDHGSCPAGQGSGLITGLKSAAEVTEALVEGSRRIYEAMARESVRV
jgi:enoyl-[acyl-carrier protein] reductase II